jgi:hypothetical protein
VARSQRVSRARNLRARSRVHNFRGQDSVALAMLAAAIGSLPERSEQGLLSLEGEEQKVGHAAAAQS